MTHRVIYLNEDIKSTETMQLVTRIAKQAIESKKLSISYFHFVVAALQTICPFGGSGGNKLV
jgi:hypothetical protein